MIVAWTSPKAWRRPIPTGRPRSERGWRGCSALSPGASGSRRCRAARSRGGCSRRRTRPIARLAREHATSAFAFARETAPATLAGLAERVKHPARPDDPAAQTTDWQPALAEALKGSGTDDSAMPPRFSASCS